MTGYVTNIERGTLANESYWYTLYSPPEHPDGTVHRTKADAE